ncbi:MAG: hypothetical protein H6815_00345 [Phycisphaeraceae bacterium]|nr:hypothetical protein [Phycisphaerales bacterium]MCB9858873.1 hypothetical protein [Phycisphaeraceae bacterium]
MPDFQYSLDGGDIVITHIASSTEVFRQDLSLTFSYNFDADIDPDITLIPIDDGLILRCSYSGDGKPYGIALLDFNIAGASYVNMIQKEWLDDPGVDEFGHYANFPGNSYMPVRIITGTDFSVCVSVHYPYETAQFDNRIGVKRGDFYSKTSLQHYVRVDFYNDPTWAGDPMEQPLSLSSEDPPTVIDVVIYFVEEGKTGAYEKSLKMFKEYAHATCDMVRKYPYDLRARASHFISNVGVSNTGNARRFNDGSGGLRADTNGFGPLVDKIIETSPYWPRGPMLWAASGCYGEGTSYDYPFAAGTGMFGYSGSTSLYPAPDATYPSLADCLTEFPRLRQRGIDFMFWHGNSDWIDLPFNNKSGTFLDPDNATHLSNIQNEHTILLTGCQGYGLGLDAMRHDYCSAYRWKELLALYQSWHPDAEFWWEPIAPFFLWAQAPSYVPLDNNGSGVLWTNRFKCAQYVMNDIVIIGHRSFADVGYGNVDQEIMHERMYHARETLQVAPLMASVMERKPQITLDPGDPSLIGGRPRAARPRFRTRTFR